ncbi:MAG TPA: DegT/DnrJ/EryC1/StrS aminotransferase family protein [Bryobacteraceae bacterium]|nr:DegT/DnrJ/EryC1/StrS aminotransferase family protein [Bryobacteraceae bacterium]
MTERRFIPFHRPAIGQAEIDAVVAALQSGWLTTGPRTAQFESEFREYVRAPHALAVNSGTAALHLALHALDIGPGDEVITTPLTFCATVNTILHVGATPVLADIGADGNIDPASIRQKLTSRTRCIMPVHYGGAPCDMHAIWSIAREHGLYVVEDAAHATGTYYGAWPIGAGDPSRGLSSDAVAFSFYATKNLVTGEGGMVTCHRADLMERMRILCLHGISKDAWNRYTEKGNWYYEVAECGFKYNLSDIQSAIGIEQLRKQEALLRLRAARACFYNELLEDVEEVETPRDSALGRHAWHLYPLRLDLDRIGISRADFIEGLRQRGIGASVHFIPIPLHPAFSGRAELAATHVPRAMALYQCLVSLPLYPDLSSGELEYIAASVKEIVHQSSRTLKAAAPTA